MGHAVWDRENPSLLLLLLLLELEGLFVEGIPAAAAAAASDPWGMWMVLSEKAWEEVVVPLREEEGALLGSGVTSDADRCVTDDLENL
mmetsp:Transcript_27455/g.43365  ORF Transcript_27455/g.43365 Transcript_27455/m.43365 type:complete len:88 (+) Transcript_27455:313-576(+)